MTRNKKMVITTIVVILVVALCGLIDSKSLGPVAAVAIPALVAIWMGGKPSSRDNE